MQTYVDPQLYSEWVEAHDTLGERDRLAIRDGVRRLPRLPLFSIVMLSPAEIGSRDASVASVQRQIYPFWELWAPGPTSLAEGISDARLRTITATSGGGHADWFNAALAAAQGEFVLPLPPDVTLSEAALYHLANAIGCNQEADLIYTDEDRISEAGQRFMPCFKTAWDPDLVLGRDAIGLLVAYRKTLLDQLGGMRTSRPDISLSIYELSLRVASGTPAPRILHVPVVLCHRHGLRDTLPDGEVEGARNIVRDHLAGHGINADVLPAPLASGWNRIVRAVPDPAPPVSIIVPICDKPDLLDRVADAVLSRTDYPSVELLIVDNDSCEHETIELIHRLSRDNRVRVLQYPHPFNYATMNNLAAREARGDILVLLNNDIDVIAPDWLREMVSHAVRPDVGAVGAKLIYPDGRVQHGGMVLGPGVWPAHQLRFADRRDPGPGGELALTRTVSIVTGACLALRRSVFFEVGGLDEKLRVVFNDIDFCLRLGDHGYRVVWTPFAELFHIEAASRGRDDESTEKLARSAEEARYFARCWKSLLSTDPFHNPNLVYGWDFTKLAAPPRYRRPWT